MSTINIKFLQVVKSVLLMGAETLKTPVYGLKLDFSFERLTFVSPPEFCEHFIG